MVGHVERRVDHVVELEVRAKLILIEIVAIAADLLGVIIVVPRLDGDVGVLTISDRLHVAHLFVHARNGRRPDAHHQVLRAIRRKRHRVGHAQIRVGWEAQDLRAFGAKAQDVGDDLVGVVSIAIVAAVFESRPHALAKRAIG